DPGAIRRAALARPGQQSRAGARGSGDGPHRGHSRHLRDARTLRGGENAGRAGAARVPAAASHPYVDPSVAHPRWHRAPRPGRDAARDRPARDPPQDFDVEAAPGGSRRSPGEPAAGPPGSAHRGASFRATLEEVRGADILLHVIDAAHPAWEQQAEVVDRETRIAEGGTWNDDASVVGRKRVVYVFNKADLLPDPEAFLAQVRERYPHAVLTSTVPRSALRVPTWVGVEGLRSVLRTSAQALRPIARIHVPLGDGKLLAALHRDAEVLA